MKTIWIRSLISFCFIISIQCIQGQKIYVDSSATGTNDGSSWTNAYRELSDALGGANAGDSICISRGTYKPDTAGLGNPRLAAFIIDDDSLVILGGFNTANGDTTLDDRDWNMHPVILSGNIGMPAFISDNSYHVLQIFSRDSIRLDGIILRDGYANGTGLNRMGGGMILNDGSTHLYDCDIRDNYASLSGGGIFLSNGSSVVLIRTTLEDNESAHEGGAIHLQSNSNLCMKFCEIRNNLAANGGGCKVSESSLRSYNSIFANNTAASSSGAVWGSQSDLDFHSCAFFGNSSTVLGGAGYFNNSTASILNCSFSNNRNSGAGADALNLFDTDIFLTNSILWGNGLEIVEQLSSTTVNYSLVSGGWAGIGNLDANPMFADTATGELSLMSGSPAIDVGINDSLSVLDSFDLAGNPRIDNDTVDMGAYESLSPACPHPDYVALIALYDSTNGPGWHDNTGWSDGKSGTNCDPCTWFGISCDGSGRVKWIDLEDNNLTGILPTQIGGLDSLQRLYLSGSPSGDDNDIQGSIPSNIGSLKNLELLDLGFNEISDSIPATIGMLQELSFLYLDYNNLSGKIPTSIGNLANLTILNLSVNQLTGSIPPSIGQLGNLTVLSLNSNSLTGRIPDSLGNLTNLNHLWLDNNELVDSIPVSLLGMSNLLVLRLNGNMLTGSIPGFLGSMTSLIHIRLQSNILSGEIPPSLGTLPNLNTLWLQNNNLSGCYPDTFKTTVCNINYNFGGNPELPWHGDMEQWCLGGQQIGAICDDGLAITTEDSIASDCQCTGNFIQKYYVDSSATGANNGASWADAFTGLNQALDAVQPGDTICVAQGTYYPTTYPRTCVNCSTDRDFTFHLVDDVKVFGGFSAGGGNIRNPTMYPSILCGDIGVPGDSTDNVHHVVISISLGNESMLDGFTIRDGLANGSGSIFVDGQQTFRNNGGGIFTRVSSTRFTDLHILDNHCSNAGGGISNTSSDIELYRCVLDGNSSGSGGGGLYTVLSSISITSCIFLSNSASNGGGIAHTIGSVTRIYNSTLSGNYVSGVGGAISGAAGQIYISNSILWGNGTEIYHSGAAPIVGFSIVSGGFAGPGNLDMDPLFVNPAAANYHLFPCSPAINAGSNDSLQVTDSIDLAGNPRLVGNTVDMGAYEYQRTPLTGASIYVDSSASGSNGGSSWADAIPDLSAAIQIAKSCPIDTVKVAKGTYYPITSFIFSQLDSLLLKGGYQSVDGMNDPELYPTILSGDIGSPGDNSDNAKHVVTVLDNVGKIEIQDVHINHGNASGGGADNDSRGGGVLAEGWLILRNCKVNSNFSANSGAVYASGSNAYLYLLGTLISGNVSGNGTAFSHELGSQVFMDENTRVEN